jgi:ABC-type oligopeptide transport system ATPase subunit
VSVGAQILNLFRDLHERLGLSLFFISHNLNVVYYLCDRIAVMYRGQIVELGAAEDVYTTPAHLYTQTLLAAAPELTPSVTPSALTASGRSVQDEYLGAETGELVNIAPVGRTPHYVRRP